MAEHAGPPGLRAYTGYLMKRAFGVVQADLVRVLAPFGLKMTGFAALTVLRHRPGISQTALAEVLDMERSNLVAVLDRLEADGLVLRTAVEGDRRSNALTATDAGRTLAARAAAAVSAHEARVFAALSPGERTALHAALARMVDEGGRDVG